MRSLPLLLAVGLLTGGCGRGPATDEPGAGGSPGTATPSPVTLPLDIHRLGGIAGFDDRLVIAPDGLATLTSRGGLRQACRVPAPLLDRVRSIRWDALPQAPLPSGRSDVLRYLVAAGGRTTMLDADVPPIGQVEAVDTVAALFSAISACPPAT